MNDLLGLPLDTKLELDPEVEANFETLPKSEYVKEAWEENPEIRAASEAVEKARAGVAGAEDAYIPDITAYARAFLDRFRGGADFRIFFPGLFHISDLARSRNWLRLPGRALILCRAARPRRSFISVV